MSTLIFLLLILLPIYSYDVPYQVKSKLVCSQTQWVIIGGNTSIRCQSHLPLWYATLTKIGHHQNVTVITIDAQNRPIFYKDSDHMNYRKRVTPTVAELQRGVVEFKLAFTVSIDSGLYVVSYKTKKDIIDQKSFVNLKIFEPPIIFGCQNTTLVEGNDGFSTCNVSGSKPLTLAWNKDSGTVSSTWNGGILVLPNITREDQGLYIIKATNRMKNRTFCAVKRFFITVHYKPESPELSVVTNSSSVFYKGAAIQIFCKADGNPLAEYSMYLNGENIIHNDNSRRGGNLHPGQLLEVKLHRIGNNTLKCVPFNKVGIGQAQLLSIFVQDHPKDPTSSQVRLEIILPTIFIVVALFAAVLIVG